MQAVALGLLLGACSTSPTEASPASADDREPSTQLACGEPIGGTEPLLVPGGLLLLGEMHGTREIPAFVGGLACQAARRGLAVRVGLEIPVPEGPALDRYLASGGEAPERAALLEGAHWLRAQQDGRSSEAVLALIERVRLLRRAGADVGAFAFDAPDEGADWNDRDGQMARTILEHARAEPEALTLVLSGNLHAWTTPGLPWDAEAIPMGVHLRRARPDLRSLTARYRGGSAWVCAPRCGATELDGDPSLEPGRRVTFAERDEHGVDGSFGVGEVHAAPPARPAVP